MEERNNGIMELWNVEKAVRGFGAQAPDGRGQEISDRAKEEG